MTYEYSGKIPFIATAYLSLSMRDSLQSETQIELILQER